MQYINNEDRPVKRRRSRTKQILRGPRHIDQTSAQKIKTMVWVTIGKTEHQAWLLEDVKEKNMVSIRWETTGAEQIVPVLSIRHEAPDDGRRSRRIRTPVQDPYRNLNDTNIQAARKRKRLRADSKVAAAAKKETTQQKESKGDGNSITSESKVESKRLTFDSSTSLDTMITKQPETTPKEKSNGDGKSSLSDVAKTKTSAFSEIWEDAKRTALSAYVEQSVASAKAKSGARRPKTKKSKEKAQSKKKGGKLR